MGVCCVGNVVVENRLVHKQNRWFGFYFVCESSGI